MIHQIEFRKRGGVQEVPSPPKKKENIKNQKDRNSY
jgi:hypothetical protein